MPLLDRNGLKPDIWQRDGSADIPADAPLLVPFSDLETHRDRNGALGVDIANTVRLADLAPHLGRLELIAIRFPGFADGRGFSIAKTLRDAGFSGTLRAVGPLIADQFAYALACGFDEVDVPEDLAARQPVDQWLSAAGAYHATYQTSHQTGAPSILERRRASRSGGRA